MQHIRNNRFISVTVLLVIIGLSTWGVAAYQTSQSDSAPTQDISIQTPADTKAGRTELSYQATPGITSLEQLKQEAGDVITTQSKYGELVDSIEGHKGGTDGKYWSFYVNGEMAQVGAGSYMQQEGDLIEWKFQKL